MNSPRVNQHEHLIVAHQQTHIYTVKVGNQKLFVACQQGGQQCGAGMSHADPDLGSRRDNCRVWACLGLKETELGLELLSVLLSPEVWVSATCFPAFCCSSLCHVLSWYLQRGCAEWGPSSALCLPFPLMASQILPVHPFTLWSRRSWVGSQDWDWRCHSDITLVYLMEPPCSVIWDCSACARCVIVDGTESCRAAWRSGNRCFFHLCSDHPSLLFQPCIQPESRLVPRASALLLVCPISA